MIKFNKYNVTNTETNQKARVYYSVDNHTSGNSCITIYAKDYTNCLEEMISEGFQDNTDYATDYFEKGSVRMFEDHPHYEAARARATA